MKVWKINDTQLPVPVYIKYYQTGNRLCIVLEIMAPFSPLSEQMQSCDAKAYQQSLVCSIEVMVN